MPKSIHLLSLIFVGLILSQGATSGYAQEDAAATPLAPPSSAAQKLYAAAQEDLLQVRVLVKNGHTQASVGSGFFVGESDLVVTNYHVISQIALQPTVYVGEFVDTKGLRGDIQLLALDVLHDLAILRVNRKGKGFFRIPSESKQLVNLSQGQYLYSLGNPLDLGFAISEGAYNGIISRAFYDQYLFTGPINAGMSGGPNITANGNLAGVNVAKRTDGELVSFLVPARFVVELLEQVKRHPNGSKDFSEEVGRQLIEHQSKMVDHILETALTQKHLGSYFVPVRESEQMRCWGRADNQSGLSYSVDKMNCAMESAVFISDKLHTGHVAISHNFFQAHNVSSLRFSRLISNQFKSEIIGGKETANLTRLHCVEDFTKNTSSDMRAVICVRAYRRFAGLYDFTLITSSLDQSKEVLQSRLDTRGVSYENGMRLIRNFIKSIHRAAGEK